METKKSKVKIPDGFKIDQVDFATGDVTFKPIPDNPREKLNTMEDILKFNGHTQESFDKWCEGLDPHEIGRREEEFIAKAYNGPHVVDFADGKPKYCPEFRMPSSSGARFAYDGSYYWLALSTVGSRQLFVGPDAYENMLDAVEKFLPQYERSRTL